MIDNDIHVAGTHLLQKGYIRPKKSEKWYRSRERRSNSYSPFCAYMMNKKWWLEEEFSNHILRFQQVNILLILKGTWKPLMNLYIGCSRGQWKTLDSERWTRSTRASQIGTFLFRPRQGFSKLASVKVWPQSTGMAEGRKVWLDGVKTFAKAIAGDFNEPFL